MPLKRTPPSTPTPEDLKEARLNAPKASFSGSAPDLSNEERSNVTMRRKQDESYIKKFITEIKDMLAKANSQNESKFTSLQSSMREILTQNTEIKDSIAFVSKQYEDMKAKYEKLEKQRNEDRLYIDQLEKKIESLERTSASTKLELRNIPKITGENKDSLCNIASKAADVIDFPIQKQDIKDIYRTKSKTGHGAIIVELGSVILKDGIIEKARKFNKMNSANRLNTAHLSLEGPAKPFFISECLSPCGKRLNYLARAFAQENGYKFCWTSFGRTYLRQDEGKRHIRIDSEGDLNKLRLKQ
ncbi:unnamed protein product [Pieris macdunnoughi]|uniref:FP protein C-terminal domain-containing protein n=1 Tax=Pieris macdunnoughi TaxID=345717 RepID=A0A821P0J6_9NEOP|nr:unnamed protein product [Pieris macdunnoughi]